MSSNLILARPPTQRSWLPDWTWRILANLLGTTHFATHGVLHRVINPVFGYRYPEAIDDTFIRLIRLPEASTSDPPDLTIHTFPVADCPPYLALSYTWGPPSPSAPPYSITDRQNVRIDGRSFSVLPNLLDALIHATTARPGSYIWVDSICINQADPAERAAQVACMDRIYAGASETLVWLGPATERSRRAIPLIQRMAEGAPARVIQWIGQQAAGDAYVADDPEMLKRNGLPPMTTDDWADIGDIVTRTWFGRVWVIQEIALSSLPTVLIGSDTLPWDDIGNAAFLVLASNALTGLYAMESGVQNGPLVLGLVQAYHVQLLRERCRREVSVYRDVAFNSDFTAGIGDKSTGTTLLTLLMASKGCKATIRQDRVYGLLGILNYTSRKDGVPMLDIKIDYTSSGEEVLKTLGFFMYNETQSLNLLSLAGEASRASPSTLASWIPSFENVNSPILGPNFANLKPFNAASDSSPIFQIDEAHCRLNVLALAPNLGSIEELGETWPDIMSGRFLRSITMLLHCGRVYEPTGEPIVEAFWRTLIMDHDLTRRPAPPDLANSFKAWFFIITITALLSAWQTNSSIFDIFDSLEPLFFLANNRDDTHLLPTSADMLAYISSAGFLPNPDIPMWTETERNSFMSNLGRTASAFEGILRSTLLLGRRLVRTVSGNLCLVPFKSEVGDKVMVIKGCPTPLVLRRVPGQNDCFRLIGDAFVHGVMFGEAVTDNSVWRDITLV